MYQAVLNIHGLVLPGDSRGCFVVPSSISVSNPGKRSDEARCQGRYTRLVLRHPTKIMAGSAQGGNVFKRTVISHSLCAMLSVPFPSGGLGASALQLSVAGCSGRHP